MKAPTSPIWIAEASYSKALLTEDPITRHSFVKAALDTIHETLRQPMIQQEEHTAIGTDLPPLCMCGDL